MGSTKASSRKVMYTELKDRTLWYDGVSSFKTEDIASKMKQYRVRWVDDITSDIAAYNSLKVPSDQIRVKVDCGPLSSEWVSEVRDITDEDVVDFVGIKHAHLLTNVAAGEISQREERLAHELAMFYDDVELWSVLKCMVYVVNELTVTKQVWGVGRGSSVSSYLLYVIGVHDVDSFKYDLDITDFITT